MNGYKELINEIPNFPKEGVSFKDISPLLANREMFRSAVIDMGRLVKNPNYWIGIDSRGFIFASALSMIFGALIHVQRLSLQLPLSFPEPSLKKRILQLTNVDDLKSHKCTKKLKRIELVAIPTELPYDKLDFFYY